MAKCVVSLYCEQRAEVEVDAPRDATPQQLQDLALLALDTSHGAEWVTISAFPEHWMWPSDGAGGAISFGGIIH